MGWLLEPGGRPRERPGGRRAWGTATGGAARTRTCLLPTGFAWAAEAQEAGGPQASWSWGKADPPGLGREPRAGRLGLSPRQCGAMWTGRV